MTFDLEMAEITKVFFQECTEGLDAMESGLLSLESTADRGNIDTIFRAAHSIKGGAATFGYTDIAAFTHGVETLLDEMRNGVRPVTTAVIQTLLQACDCLREIMSATEAAQPLDQDRISALNGEISHILGAPPADSTPAQSTPAAPRQSVDAVAGSGWRVLFEPVAELLRLRNEPTRMFAELQRLGTLTVNADASRLPLLDSLDPEACYLSWNLELAGAASRQQVGDVFDWVDARCRLEITAIDLCGPGPALTAAPTYPAPLPAAPAGRTTAGRDCGPQAWLGCRVDQGSNRKTGQDDQLGR